MARRKAEEQAYGKALDLWQAPEGAGDARFCIASTFTFDATFFETECLGRFLGMDAHPAESESVSYMVEREEKLAAARVVVLADRRHARDKESLRWDVLGVLPPRQGIQHSKISVLGWANHVRVIIGSGNLTEPGYRKNVEVFGTLEISRASGGDLDQILKVLEFLEVVVTYAVGSDAENAPKARARAAVQSVRALIGAWPNAGRKTPAVVLGGLGSPVLSQVRDLWPGTGPARKAYVVSPFFDLDGTDVATALLGALAARGEREIYFDVRTEPRPDGRTRIFAPRGLIDVASKKAEVFVRPVLPEQSGELRPLHAKLIYLNNDDFSLVLVGSSNFTRGGLGVEGANPNFEANLAYALRAGSPEASVVDHVWPDVGEPIDWYSDALIWDPVSEKEEEGGSLLPLPAAFEEATYLPGSPPSLAITLAEPLPSQWTIRLPRGRVVLASSSPSGPGTHVIALEPGEVTFVLEVSWTYPNGVGTANWPVNVSNPAALPPPEALRTLTLDELLQVLASTRPMPQAVAEVLAKRKGKSASANSDLDPLRRFDSQASLLRRTKRLSTVLERLRDRLERPASSREAYEWRLFGPVGPIALSGGYARDTTPGEGKFCLAEIALTLHRVRPEAAAVDGFSRAAVKELLHLAIEELKRRADELPPEASLDRYVTAAFSKAMV